MQDIAWIWEYANRIGVIALLLSGALALHLGWIVMGRHYKELVEDRDKWAERYDQLSGLMDRLFDRTEITIRSRKGPS